MGVKHSRKGVKHPPRRARTLSELPSPLQLHTAAHDARRPHSHIRNCNTNPVRNKPLARLNQATRKGGAKSLVS